MQRSALCRSRRELSNEYLLAKIGVDTAETAAAENEPLEVWGKIIQFVSLLPTRYQAKAGKLRTPTASFLAGLILERDHFLERARRAGAQIAPCDNLGDLYIKVRFDISHHDSKDESCN